jgi:CDP-glycerol glycerophosphotransferase (TagB/SpsB family)
MRAVFFCHYLPALHQLLPLQRLLGGALWTDDAEIVRAVRRLAPSAPLRRFLFSSHAWVSRRARGFEADVFVGANAHPYFFNRVTGPRVQCFHGVSSKGFAAQWRNTRYFDLCLLAGERMRRDFERAGLTETVRCEVVGYIRGDRLTHGAHDVGGFRRAHGLDAQEPTVLYAPTWSGLSSFNRHGLEIVNAVPREWNLIMKLHPWTLRRREAPQMVRAVRRAVKARPRAVFLSHDEDIYPAMGAADLLVGDRSSICEEWLLLDRPLVLFDHLSRAEGLDPETQMLHERGDWDDLHRCGPVVHGGEELRAALLAEHRDPSARRAERLHMRDFVFHLPDGQATQRAADAIRRLGDETRGRVFGMRIFD